MARGTPRRTPHPALVARARCRRGACFVAPNVAGAPPPPRAAPPRRARARCRWGACFVAPTVAPPPPPRTNRTRRVPHPVLIGHAASPTPGLSERGWGVTGGRAGAGEPPRALRVHRGDARPPPRFAPAARGRARGRARRRRRRGRRDTSGAARGAGGGGSRWARVAWGAEAGGTAGWPPAQRCLPCVSPWLHLRAGLGDGRVERLVLLDSTCVLDQRVDLRPC
jgi:hypothetical protein